MKLWKRVRRWSGRRAAESDLAGEIRLHREMLEEQFVADGMPREEARTAAAREFGNTTVFLEQSREQWNLPWLAGALKDLQFAWRLARRQPLLSAAAILTIAFGVGANTAIVSVLETVLLNPVGLRDSNRIVVARVRIDKIQFRHVQASAVEFRELQGMTDAFTAVAAEEGHYWTAQVGGEPVRLIGRSVTPDYFRVFRVNPDLGRFFTPEDRESVVLSHSYWTTQFGGDRAVIGRPLILDGRAYRIVGVAPADFRFPPNARIWTSLYLAPNRFHRGYNMNLWVFARLRDGVSVAKAADRVNRYMSGLDMKAEGYEGFGYGVEVDPISDFVVGDLRRPLWILWAAALVVLLTGCANVAGLLLTRAAGRRREMAIRISIGASRLRIVRQLLVESLLLGALGGLAGLPLAGFAAKLIARLPLESQWLELVKLDARTLAYGFALALASGLLFGLAPALQLLRESQAAAVVRSRPRWVQDVFVAAEVAGAFALVATTALLLRSLWAVESIRPGFDVSNLATAFVLKPNNDPGFLDRLRVALEGSPAVESAALAKPIPFSGAELTSSFGIRYREHQAGQPEWHGEAYMVTPEYLHTMRIPLLRGRNFADSDTATSPTVCLIDAKLARTFFPNEDPVGKEIGMYKDWARIVGVVGTVRGSTLEEGSRPIVYYSLAQMPFFPDVGIVVRSRVPAGAVIRDAVRHANASVAVYDMASMDERIAESLGLRRVLAWLLAIFGGISLLLAVVGIYAVVAHIIGERTMEIGIRIALGAKPVRILASFAGQGLRAGAIGLACGLLAAIWAQRWVALMLYRVQPFDAVTYVSAGIGVLALLLAAVWWPARRASRIDPQQALHYE